MFQKPCNLSRAATYYLGGGDGGGQGYYPQAGASFGQQSSGGPLNTDFPNSGKYKAGSMFRGPSTEAPILQNWFNRQINNFGAFRDADKLLGPATTGALDFWKQLPGMLSQFKGFGDEISGDQSQIQGYQGQLGDLFKQLGGMIPGIQSQISGYQGQLGDILKGLPGQFQGYQNQLARQQGQLPGQFAGYQNQLGGLYGQLAQQAQTLGGLISSPFGPAAITATGGALTDQQARDVSQQTRGIEAAQGTAHSTGALGNELLNRDAYRQQRYNTALQQEQGLLGQQQGVYGQQAGITGQQAGLGTTLSQLMSGLTGQRAGLTQALTGLQSGLIGQRAGLTGLGTQLVSGLLGQQGGLAQSGAGLSAMLAGLTGQKAGLLGQQQALQTGGLNQLLGVGNAAVSQYGGLTNPILSYLGNLFGGNQQAAIAQAQIDAQQSAAGDSKKAGATSAGGSIIGALIPAIIGL